MSSKWRTLQHRHRYTYTSIVFPKHYLGELSHVPTEINSSNFFSHLNNLISLTSTYAQVIAAKDLASAFVQFLSSPAIPDGAVLVAMKLYLEILFLENSLPLHRTLISVLVKCKKYCSVISGCFALLCEEYGGSGSKANKRFLVSRAALSLIGYPKLGFLDESVKKCAEIMALDVVAGLDGVIRDIVDGSRPSPVVMEQCQEAMSCMYYLLQRYPSKFTELDKASTVFKSVIRTILIVLKSSSFSRDCLVASGVSFCAAMQVFMSAEDIYSIFAMLGFINVGPSAKSSKLDVALKNDQCVAALVPLLKVSWNLALVEGDIDLDPDEVSQKDANKCAAIIYVRGVNVTVPVKCDKDFNCSDTVKATTVRRAEDLFQFMKWLSSFLFNSCYPSGPYERKTIAMDLILTLLDWLCTVVEEGEKDLSEACKKSFVHGVLLTMRYTFDELDWNSEVLQSCIAEMRCLVEKLLQLIMRVTSLALWVVSSDAWYMLYDVDDMIDDGSFLSDTVYEDQPDTASEIAEMNTKSGHNGKPAEHIVMVGCWLAMKEVSLLFGTIIRKIPLPGCSSSNSSHDGLAENTEETIMSGEILDVEQLEKMGNHFLQVLLKMKHNGAIDKTRAGLTALCNRLLCSNDSRLCKMTESWMVLLMDRTVAKGQIVDDLLQRSAGIPAAFIALFLAEPEGTPKKLLPQALEWLIEFAKTSLANFPKDWNQKLETVKDFLGEPCESQSGTAASVHSNGHLSKSRNEGVVPTVHVFNVLRAAFNGANLATDTSGFCAEATIVAIHAFSSPYWEVRNAVCLAYTALVRRMVGFLNVHKCESARRSITGLEFFHRQVDVVCIWYPALHPFLFSELKVATELLVYGLSGNLEEQLSSLLDNYFRGLTDRTKKDHILSQLIEVLSKCSWLGCTKLCTCPVVSTSYLRILDLMLDVARTGRSGHTDAIQTLLSELSYQCLNNGTSTHYAFHDPTQIELRQQATASYFSCAGLPKRHDETTEEDIPLQILDTTSSISEMRWEVSLPELHKRIMSCLADLTYDVRITSAPSETVNARRAAAEAIIASGLLEEANLFSQSLSNAHIPSEYDESHIEEKCSKANLSEFISLYACKILDLWFICVQLLEDEDIH
ncbi:hypothetical protein ABZP36_026111 [Zizania latifolia]